MSKRTLDWMGQTMLSSRINSIKLSFHRSSNMNLLMLSGLHVSHPDFVEEYLLLTCEDLDLVSLDHAQV